MILTAVLFCFFIDIILLTDGLIFVLEMVNDAVIPIVALGIQYYGGPVVTILDSKTSRKSNLMYFIASSSRISF